MLWYTLNECGLHLESGVKHTPAVLLSEDRRSYCPLVLGCDLAVATHLHLSETGSPSLRPL